MVAAASVRHTPCFSSRVLQQHSSSAHPQPTFCMRVLCCVCVCLLCVCVCVCVCVFVFVCAAITGRHQPANVSGGRAASGSGAASGAPTRAAPSTRAPSFAFDSIASGSLRVAASPIRGGGGGGGGGGGARRGKKGLPRALHARGAGGRYQNTAGVSSSGAGARAGAAVSASGGGAGMGLFNGPGAVNLGSSVAHTLSAARAAASRARHVPSADRRGGVRGKSGRVYV